MSNVNRLHEMAGGRKGLDGWRLRNLTEETALQVKKQITEITAAFQLVSAKVDKGDVAGASELLVTIQESIKKTIEGLK